MIWRSQDRMNGLGASGRPVPPNFRGTGLGLVWFLPVLLIIVLMHLGHVGIEVFVIYMSALVTLLLVAWLVSELYRGKPMPSGFILRKLVTTAQDINDTASIPEPGFKWWEKGSKRWGVED